jgi:hypothetical protein
LGTTTLKRRLSGKKRIYRVMRNMPLELQKNNVRNSFYEMMEAVAKLQFCNSNLLKMHVS